MTYFALLSISMICGCLRSIPFYRQVRMMTDIPKVKSEKQYMDMAIREKYVSDSKEVKPAEPAERVIYKDRVIEKIVEKKVYLNGKDN